jgi:hypothetical protein
LRALFLRLTRRRPAAATAGALALYVALSVACFGTGLPFRSGRTYVGDGTDPQIFIWSFAWWPHAILHGQNPFVTHAIWAPSGDNLAWATSVPGLALAFAPLTLLAGPVASYDAAAVLMPALAAWTSFVLCRYLTRSAWPSLAGGYVFGFSGYMLGELKGHLHLTSIFLLPLVALVLVRYAEGRLTGRALVVRLGPLIALQLSFSTEIAFTLTLVLITTLLLAYALVPSARPQLRSLPAPLAGAYVLAALLVAPLLYYALSDFRRTAINGVSPTEYSADVLNFVIPTDLVSWGAWTHVISRHFTGNILEQGAYIGAPAVAIVLWLGVRQWRNAATRLLLASLAIVVFVSFGSWLHVAGHQVVTLPWEHIGYLPVFANVLPVRFCAFVALGVSVAVAIWASSTISSAAARVSLTSLALLALVPNLHEHVWRTTVHEPAFISKNLYRNCLTPGDNVLVLPFGQHGDSMLWQAVTSFRYRMAGGYVSPTPPESFRSPPEVRTIASGGVPSRLAALPTYIRLKRVTAVLVDARTAEPWRTRLNRIFRPSELGGVFVYRTDIADGVTRAGCGRRAPSSAR